VAADFMAVGVAGSMGVAAGAVLVRAEVAADTAADIQHLRRVTGLRALHPLRECARAAHMLLAPEVITPGLAAITRGGISGPEIRLRQL
jgi:hypothetical protein